MFKKLIKKRSNIKANITGPPPMSNNQYIMVVTGRSLTLTKEIKQTLATQSSCWSAVPPPCRCCKGGFHRAEQWGSVLEHRERHQRTRTRHIWCPDEEHQCQHLYTLHTEKGRSSLTPAFVNPDQPYAAAAPPRWARQARSR